MRRCLVGVLVLAVCMKPVIGSAAEEQYTVKALKNNMVAMRDGRQLSTDLYMPEAENGTFPVIFLRTIHSKSTAFDNNTVLQSLLRRGYVIAIQDIGDRRESEGKDVAATRSREDGYDTVNWLIAQDWSNQKVGTAGCSYPGETQVALAIAKHPNHLAAIPMPGASGYDAHFRTMDFVQPSDTIDVPALFMDSWYGDGVAESLAMFNHFQKNGLSERARNNQFIIIGPGTHCNDPDAGEKSRVGTRDPGDARPDFSDIRLRWYDHWLKGIDNGITGMPKIQYYLMGKNEWRSANQWPLARTTYRKLYLHSGGNANSRMGDGVLSFTPPAEGGIDKFVYDPATPVPSQGGNTCYAGGDTQAVGYDQSAVEMRNDVLVYTSAVLEQGIEVSGPLKVILRVSSSAVDTDFTAKLVDVYPDGKAFNIQEGALRMRYRDGLDKEVLMVPDRIYEIRLDLHASSNYFDRGHRIRLEVSSSNFPRWERNLNTGGNNDDETEWQTATNRVFHLRRNLSYLLLPVIENN